MGRPALARSAGRWSGRDTGAALPPGVGDRLRFAREELRFTARELATRIGVEVDELLEAEHGQDHGAVNVLVGFALYFPDVDATWLLSGRGDCLLPCTGNPADAPPPLDVEALSFAERLFAEELQRSGDDVARRMTARRGHHVALIYQTFLSHLQFFQAAGRAQPDARRLAQRACEAMREREATRDAEDQDALRRHLLAQHVREPDTSAQGGRSGTSGER